MSFSVNNNPTTLAEALLGTASGVTIVGEPRFVGAGEAAALMSGEIALSGEGSSFTGNLGIPGSGSCCRPAA